MQLGAFVKELALITGNDKLDSLTSLLADANKSAVDIPDDIVSGIKGKIYTYDSAIANNAIHDHFKDKFTALGLNGVDTELHRFLEDEKIDPSIIAEIKAEGKTAKKAIKIVQKLRELEQAKINTTGGDKKVLSDKITSLETDLAKLNADLVKEKEEASTKLAEKESEMLNKLRDYQVDKHFSSYQFANDKIPLSVHVMTAKGLFDQKAKELGLKTVFDKETGQVRLLTSADSIYYKDNKPVDYKSFTDGVLAENHLLKVTDTTGSPEQGKGNDTKVISINGAGKALNTSKMGAALNQSLADMKTGSEQN